MSKKPTKLVRATAPAYVRPSLTFNGKKTSIKLLASEWEAFQELLTLRIITFPRQVAQWRLNAHEAIVPRIREELAKEGVKVYVHATREAWLTALVDAMRPVFAERGYPLPKKITATMGFPSKGWRGKAIGECWSSTASKSGNIEIFIHPCLTSLSEICSVLTHELCHAAHEQHHINSGKPVEKYKPGHGKVFTNIGLALDLEGAPKHMSGGKAWRSWAEALWLECGPMPFDPLAAYMAKEKPKQKARMLKCECPECNTIWRTARAGLETIAENSQYLRCIDPNCIGEIDLDALFADLDEAEGGE